MPLIVALAMHAAPAVPAPAADPAADKAAPADSPRNLSSECPWLYRSEGFAEDLDGEGNLPEPKPDSPLVRWGLPLVALVGVVGMAAAFSLV
jgi:hypothetical protein